MTGKKRRKFTRQSTLFYKRLGKNRKKLQKWRRPRGRHNKLRNHRKGRPARVTIGFRTANKIRGMINGKIPILVRNIKDLERIERNSVIIIGKMGKRKRTEIEKKASEKGIKILNMRKDEKN